MPLRPEVGDVEARTASAKSGQPSAKIFGANPFATASSSKGLAHLLDLRLLVLALLLALIKPLGVLHVSLIFRYFGKRRFPYFSRIAFCIYWAGPIRGF